MSRICKIFGGTRLCPSEGLAADSILFGLRREAVSATPLLGASERCTLFPLTGLLILLDLLRLVLPKDTVAVRGGLNATTAFRDN